MQSFIQIRSKIRAVGPVAAIPDLPYERLQRMNNKVELGDQFRLAVRELYASMKNNKTVPARYNDISDFAKSYIPEGTSFDDAEYAVPLRFLFHLPGGFDSRSCPIHCAAICSSPCNLAISALTSFAAVSFTGP